MSLSWIRIAEIVAETNADFGTAINEIVSAHLECSETTITYDYEDGHTWASYWPEVLANKSLLVFKDFGSQHTTTKESNDRYIDVAPEYMTFMQPAHVES